MYSWFSQVVNRVYSLVDLVLCISPAIVLYTQVFLQLITQVVLLLLHVSAESHSNLQGVQYGVLTNGLHSAYLNSDLYCTKTGDRFFIIRCLNTTFVL